MIIHIVVMFHFHHRCSLFFLFGHIFYNHHASKKRINNDKSYFFQYSGRMLRQKRDMLDVEKNLIIKTITKRREKR